MIKKQRKEDANSNPVETDFDTLPLNMYETSLIQLDFVKSALTVNPCMVSRRPILLLEFL